MLMALLVGVGLLLLGAFLGRSMLPAPWNRITFLVLGLPSIGLLVLGGGAAVYFYSACEETWQVVHDSADQTMTARLKTIDCGDPEARTYDVTVSFLDSEGKPVDRTILRAHGKPAPNEVTETGPKRFAVTFEDGNKYETTLQGDKSEPDRVWSIIDGKVLP